MPTTLETLSQELSGLVETVAPSVVRVDGRRRRSATGIAWSADGLIVAANHTVTRTENLTIGLHDGSTVAAEVVGFDPTTDVIVLRAMASGLAVPKLVPASEAKPGSLAVSVARPGSSTRAALGVLHTVGAEWRTGAGGRIDAYLEADLEMFPGFSGAPLVTASGGVLGMLTSAFRGAVAIPAGTLERVVGALVAHGKVRRGYLGVSVQGVRLPESAGTELDQSSGLLVTSIGTDAPAGTAGVLVGDILVALGGRTLARPDDLLAALTEIEAGATVQVRLVRGGELTTLPVTIVERRAGD